MCTTCGCGSSDGAYTIHSADGKHHHHGNPDHAHEHQHSHDHHHDHENKVMLETDILMGNKLQAERNRGYFEGKEAMAFNLVSSPGSGKTALLEKTLNDLKDKSSFFVIEGDQQTVNDANRISATGTKAVQVNTGDGCHLDAQMVNDALKELKIDKRSVVFIENVGNLVCPALFDLGETKRVVIISVTEGDDKALKYPNIFHTSDLCIINKTDLLPYVQFDIEKFKENALKVNHLLEFIECSVYNGNGMALWYQWIESQKGI